MCLLPRPAEDVDSKDSRMKGLFISRKKLCFWRQKEKWSMLYPGSGLDNPTDRDQRSWVFLNNPKNTLPLTENPPKILSEQQTLKIPSEITIHLANLKLSTI